VAALPVPEGGQPEERVGAVEQPVQRSRIWPPGCVVELARSAVDQRHQVEQRRQLVVLELVHQGKCEAERPPGRRESDRPDRIVGAGRQLGGGRCRLQRDQRCDTIADRLGQRAVVFDEERPGHLEVGLPSVDRSRGQATHGLQEAEVTEGIDVIEADGDREAAGTAAQAPQREPGRLSTGAA